MQKETDPWTNTGQVNADMTNACAVNFNNKIKIFGIGPGADIASGLDMNEDNFKWSTVGQGNFTMSKIRKKNGSAVFIRRMGTELKYLLGNNRCFSDPITLFFSLVSSDSISKF